MTTPLHYAIQGGLNAMQLLLEHGANVDVKDKWGRTPLHCASSEGRDITMQFLIDHGADVNIKNGAGRTPLDCAMRNRDIWIMRLLLDHGAKVNASSAEGTPLHQASYYGYTDGMKLLLDYDANVNARDRHNKMPLHCTRDIDAMKLLLDHGANVNAKDKDGYTPLRRGVYNADKVRLLKSYGAYE